MASMRPSSGRGESKLKSQMAMRIPKCTMKSRFEDACWRNAPFKPPRTTRESVFSGIRVPEEIIAARGNPE